MRFTGIKDLQNFIASNSVYDKDKVVLSMENLRNEIKAGMPHISKLNVILKDGHMYFYNGEKMLEYEINLWELV